MNTITHEASARHCRAMADILPELAQPLEALELRFLRQAMRKKTGLTRILPSLDQRRLEVAQWPDLLDQLQTLARQRELGLPLVTDTLKEDLERLVGDFASNDENGQVPENGLQLRQAAALLNSSSTLGLENLADWTRLLGERDPRRWSPRHLRRVARQIERSQHVSHFRLDEILFLEFAERLFRRMGGLIYMLRIPASFTTSPFAWKGNREENRPLAKAIEDSILEVEKNFAVLATLLYGYPRIWRDLTGTEAAIEASIRAVVAIINSCLAPIHDQYVFPENADVFVRMNHAVKDLAVAVDPILEQVDEKFPGRVNFDNVSGGFCTVFDAIYLEDINLSSPPGLWRGLLCALDLTRSFDSWGATPSDLRYIQEIYAVTPGTREVILPA